MGVIGASKKNGGEFFSGYDVNIKSTAILAAFVIIVAASIVAVFNLAVTDSAKSEIASQQDGISATTTLQSSSKLAGEECIGFGEDAVMCENYAALALEKYPGEVSKVSKSWAVNKKSGANETLWIVDINLATPVDLPVFIESGTSGKTGPSTTVSAVKNQASRIQAYVNQATNEVGGKILNG